MDDLNVAAQLVTLVVLCDQYHYAILDKYIMDPTYGTVLVLDA